jgi:hypothetical protein
MRLLLATLLLLAAPAALAQKADDKAEARTSVADSPFVGTWDYVVTTDDGDEETGTFTIQAEGDHLGGTFVTDTTSLIDPFAMAGDAVAFTFKHPAMNVIAIRGTLAGDRFEGEAEVVAQEIILPFVATRQAEAAPADQ